MNKSKIASPGTLRFLEGTGDHCELVQLDGEWYNRVSNSHLLPEFMMTLTSSSNHWMFVSSYGALTAGRQNSDQAIFPYYSADKILDTRKQTGPRTILRLSSNGKQTIWQPFFETAVDDHIHRNLYKSPLGNKICFEEVNAELGLIFSYRWTTSHQFGIVRTSWVTNFGKQRYEINMLDGLQNILPFGTDETFQLQFGNLLDAYKKNELTETGIGLYYLSSVPTDKAEPSEGLRACIAWSASTPNATLLSQDQFDQFLAGHEVTTELDQRGKRGNYLLNFKFRLDAGDQVNWDIVADTGYDQKDVIDLAANLQAEDLRDRLQADIATGESKLFELIAKSDGCQSSERDGKSLRHQSNVMFNIMRGGVPIDGYEICCEDLRQHIGNANISVRERHADLLDGLSDKIDRQALVDLARETGDKDLIRIVIEYLPLVFSRRHGDPTRPWNKFSIDSDITSDNKAYHYQGNWRDIFQNWEALAFSYPHLIQGMISRFVNASTADGYNPYRLTKNGFEWEKPEPENPWANIGYWCDHQIIYLCKLLELSEQFFPSMMDGLLDEQVFVYANVPYRIKSVDKILETPRDTVEFDLELSNRIETEAETTGNDAKLLRGSNAEIHSATLAEKLMLPLLVKLSNFVPDGGVWLNTQRPEWNDANNALVGSGLSIVTTCYMRRYIQFLADWFGRLQDHEFEFQEDIAWLLDRVQLAISPYVVADKIEITNEQRHQIVMDLSNAGSKYRGRLYEQGLSEKRVKLSAQTCIEFFEHCTKLLDATIASNKRADGLFHAYNLMSMDVEGEIQIERLYEMLEGQVAVLSSGYLSASQSIEVLDALRTCNLYREDQDSYLLYPDRDLPRFLEKNLLKPGLIKQSSLLQQLIEDGDESIIRKDIFGNCHFNGDFRNRNDVEAAVDRLAGREKYQPLLPGAKEQIGNIFENVFCHHQFTGRSGTFFAYEGLGSIYWHMVSKLLLAVSEIYVQAEAAAEPAETLEALEKHFHAIQTGLGAEKTPANYGAFPTDPYSHTPGHAGAQQPGMTGQVKEDILSRFTEMGVRIEQGQVHFLPSLLPADEFSEDGITLTIWENEKQTLSSIEQDGNCFAFTLCGVPVIYTIGNETELKVHRSDGSTDTSAEAALNESQSRDLFARNGAIRRIELSFKPDAFC